MKQKTSKYQGLVLKTLHEEEYIFKGGTHKVGQLLDTSYYDIIQAFGSPTYYGSGDNKVQMTWVIEVQSDNGVETMEIYDWKTYDMKYTINSLDSWSIGGTSRSNPYILNAFVESTKRKECLI
tara:strand:+ start:1896 stop:2264 length:369 start_codon:yes stop_codon:yes gene_type:complete